MSDSAGKCSEYSLRYENYSIRHAESDVNVVLKHWDSDGNCTVDLSCQNYILPH